MLASGCGWGWSLDLEFVTTGVPYPFRCNNLLTMSCIARYGLDRYVVPCRELLMTMLFLQVPLQDTLQDITGVCDVLVVSNIDPDDIAGSYEMQGDPRNGY